MINKDKVYENKKEDKHWIKKYIIILIASMCAGACLSIGLMNSENLYQVMGQKTMDGLSLFTPFANIFILVIGGTVVISLYKKARKLYSKWDSENEEEIAYIERLMNYDLWFTFMMMVLSFFFFAVGNNIIGIGFNNKISWIYWNCWFLGFIFATIFIVIAQQKIVNFLKEINPEKKGSVFDIKFSKKWLESCDEAEKLVIYKSSYKSFRMVNITCIILWLVCVLGMMFWNFSMGPVTIVTIIWFVQGSTYCLECIRIQKSCKL